MKIGKKKTTYRLRIGVFPDKDVGPIPMLYLEDGSVVPVEKSELPVKLPKDVDFSHPKPS